MDLKLVGRNLEISQRLRQHITRKLEQIERHLPAAAGALVEVTAQPTRSQGERILVQVSLQVNGATIRAEGRGAGAMAAVNMAAARLGPATARYKSHAYRSQRARQYLSLGQQQAADFYELDRELARELTETAGERELAESAA